MRFVKLITSSVPTYAVGSGLAKARDDCGLRSLRGVLRWLGVTITVLAGLVAMPVSATATDAECLNDPELADDINLAVFDAMHKSGTPGLALGVIRQGKVVYLQGHGVERRDASTLVQVTCRTRFHAASVSKPVIATAFMQAFGAGELSQDQRLDELLGEGDLKPSLASLMTHTAGLRDWLRADARRTETQKEAYLQQILR